MQEEGAQSWPVEKAIDIASQLVPKTEDLPTQRAKKYLDWAADHTGILRFQEVPGRGEQIRFWHRIFREYLAACRIAQLDTTASQKIKTLWNEKRLSHPFWEDVVRLLPRTLGTFEKAKSVRQTLEKLAAKSTTDRGRLLALAAAGIIENRDLFPDVIFSKMAWQMVEVYKSEGLSWRLLDRLLFLEALGRLDPKGDPRLHSESWVHITALKTQRNISMNQKNGNLLGERLVTVQEFIEFIDSANTEDDELWVDMPPAILEGRKSLRGRVLKQRRHPNWPVVEIGVGEAIAYCRWRTRQRADGKIVRLPTSSDWQVVLSSRSLRFPWGNAQLKRGEEAQVNWVGTALGHPSPVGAFPPHPTGFLDLLGNVWEWGLETRIGSRMKRRRFSVFGLSFQVDFSNWKRRTQLWTDPPSDFEVSGYPSIGFRCLLSDYDLKVSSVDFARKMPSRSAPYSK